LKEDSIHEWTVKTPLQLLRGEQQIAAALKTEPQPIVQNQQGIMKSEVSHIGSPTDKIGGNPVMLKENIPSKKPKTNLSSIYKRESLKFLPKMSEIVVSIVPPKITAPKKTPLSSVEYLRSRILKNHMKRKSIRRGIRTLLKNRKQRGIRVPLTRRFSPKGSLLWICRNFNTGYKCHNIKCVDRCWKFPTKSAQVLHHYWFHRFRCSNLRSFNCFCCDSCDQQFKHLYQAFLHKLRYHPVVTTDVASQGSTNSTTVSCHEQSNIFQFTQPPHPHAV